MKTRKRKYLVSPGQRFGRLIIIDESVLIDKRGYRERRLNCICDCGKIVNVRLYSIFNKTKSCGCYARDRSAEYFRTHGLHYDPAYLIFKLMKRRCYLSQSKNYKNYGGRGITICDEWLNDPKLFVIWAYNHGYRKGLSIERVNNNEGYSPENCIFADRIIQANNRRTNHIIIYNNKNYSMANFCRKYDLNYSIFCQRIITCKYSIERAMINCGHYIPMNKTEIEQMSSTGQIDGASTHE